MISHYLKVPFPQLCCLRNEYNHMYSLITDLYKCVFVYPSVHALHWPCIYAVNTWKNEQQNYWTISIICFITVLQYLFKPGLNHMQLWFNNSYCAIIARYQSYVTRKHGLTQFLTHDFNSSSIFNQTWCNP